MANSNAPFGLRPVKKIGGGVITPNTVSYTIASGLAENIYFGDAVDLAGSATVNGSTIKLATAGTTNPILGSFAGVSYKDSAGVPQFRQYWATGTVATEIKAHVFDDPDIIFEVQSDSTGIALNDVGMNVCLEAGSGSTTTGSGHVLDGSGTPATTVGFQFKILGMSEHPTNEAGAYAKALVRINVHRLAPNTIGV